MPFENPIEMYLTIGAGGLALLTLIWVVYTMISKINPTLQNLQSDNASFRELTRASTDAVKEISRSNDNIASALTLIDATQKTLISLLERHDERSQRIEVEVIKIKERV